jgi:hypothetical protein
VLIGALMALFIGAATPYTNMIIKGSLLAHNTNTPVALFSFFIFVAAINVALKLARRSYALEPGELATVYIMAMLATAIPTVGFSEYLLPIIAGLYYYATPENQWAEIIHPHVPEWMAPQDQEAIRHFFEGLPSGQPVPWEVWIQPLVCWSVLILAVFWVSACIMVILRKQWMENEKLLYPLVQVATSMLHDDGRSLIKPFFKSPIMWAGFAIPFLVGSCNALHFYYPFIPGLGNWSTEFSMFRDTTVLRIMINMGVIGIAYLLNRDVALGLWVFFLVAHLERGMFNVFGIESTEKLSRFTGEGGPYLSHQAMGAMIVLVLSGLWMGRDHLKDVFRKAFNGASEVADNGEVLSYRTAVWGLIGGLAIVGAWLWASGLPLWIVPVFLFALFVILMALTRATVEGGMPHLRTPLTPTDFVISGLGTDALGTSGVIALGFTHVWAANLRIFFMACFANALKVAEEIEGNKKPLAWAMALGVVVALAGSIWSILELSYAYGGVNLHVFFQVAVPQEAAKNMATALANPTPANFGGWLFTGIGAVVMGLLTYARARFMWWPIHPLGFAVTEYRLSSFVWFSVMLAWAIKVVVLKYGGPALYRRARPFFLGLLLGQISVAGLWLIIDHFTGTIGNLPFPWHSSFI